MDNDDPKSYTERMAKLGRKRQDQINAAWKKWYAKNADSYNADSVSRLAKRRENNRAWIEELRRTLKCETCGFDNPFALDFHHREKAAKLGTISDAIRDGWPRDRVIEEIEKCQVLCANCHRIAHRGNRI